MGKSPSFESLGVHSTLVAALRRIGMQPTPFQARVLATTTTDFADVVVDGRAACGAGGGAAGADGNVKGRAVVAERHALITIFAVHCLLSARAARRSAMGAAVAAGWRGTAVVVASNKDCAAQLQKSMKTFAPQCRIECCVLVSWGQQPPPMVGGADGDGGERQLSPSTSSFAVDYGRIIITTLRVLRLWDKEFLQSVTMFAVDDVSRNDERQLEEVLRLLTVSSSSHFSLSSSGHSSSNVAASRHATNIFLMTSASLTKLSPGIRYTLSRRNRRYYHLPCKTSTVETEMPLQTPSNTLPPSSTRTIYLLYLNENDREGLLRRLLKMFHSSRILLLTHHKEIKRLYQTISGWDLYDTSNATKKKGMGHACFMLRSDTVERQEIALMNFISDSAFNNTSGSARDSEGGPKNSSTLLLGWDAFTAVDMMDVDVLIQYYPPQKSLTTRERAEYIQVLHTTADPEKSSRGRFTLLITFLAVSDFTLASFFMQQYGLSGHILNLSPDHPDFEWCLMEPNALLRLKQNKAAEQGDKGDISDPNQIINSAASLGGGSAGASVPLPRSMRYSPVKSYRERERERDHRTRSNTRKGNTNAASTAVAGAVVAGDGGGGGNTETNNSGAVGRFRGRADEKFYGGNEKGER